jgi:hypothetical protein
MEIRHPVTEDKAYAGYWFHERNRKPRATGLGRTGVRAGLKQPSLYFGCSFSAAELMQ